MDNCSLIPGCTPTGTSTTPSPPNPTATNSVVIGLRTIGLLSVGGVGSSEEWWDLYDAVKNGYDGCAKALYEQGVSASADNQKYPTKLGPFDLSGPRNCYYGAPDSNTVGTVTCDNGVSIPCAEDSSASDSICNPPELTQSDSFIPLLYCNYTPS